MFDKALTDNSDKASEVIVLAARMLTAIAQAAALYLLTQAASSPVSWPATDPELFVPLLLVSSYVPLVIVLGVGQIRAYPLAIWVALATVLIAVLGYHDAARGRLASYGTIAVFWPTFRIWLSLSASLFVAHVLFVDSIRERRLLPSYSRHFDTAWKQGAQIALALAFVGAFWIVLRLGATLFSLVKIHFFRELITHPWFVYPTTTLAFAVSVHTTDVLQPSLIRGARSLTLTLFSWLLPLLVVIILGFLVSLPFISLNPLWSTHFATSLLLAEAGWLVFLINCCYQDGAPEHATSRIKRLAGLIGSIELIPLVGLAIWGLSLRVEQYGWSVERIMAAAVSVAGSCYAIGYAGAVARSPSWLKRIEIANFLTAYVFLALVVALFSPIADPARLMVASQVARLKSGAVRPEKFDFAALKFEGSRWGATALAELSRLKDQPDAIAIATRAARALALTSIYNPNQPDGKQPTSEEMAQRVAVYPVGRTLPAIFYDMRRGPMVPAPMCFRIKTAKCLARFMVLQPGEKEAILFIDLMGADFIFEQDTQGQWRKTGLLAGASYCNSLVFQSLESGDFKLGTPSRPDLVIGDQHLSISPLQHFCQLTPPKFPPSKMPPGP